MKLKKFYKDKKILVAGGTGMVGQMLVPKLLSMGSEVYIASMDNPSLAPKGIKKFYLQESQNTLKKVYIGGILSVAEAHQIKKMCWNLQKECYCGIIMSTIMLEDCLP